MKLPLSVAPLAVESEPDIAPEHQEAVVAAVRWAWLELYVHEPSLLKSGKEEEITLGLQRLLNRYNGGERCAHWIADFDTVTRSEYQTTADGRIEKKPDMTFRPPPYNAVRNTTAWGWFVECKIVNGSSSVSAYRDKGIARFSSGEYARLMPSGAMLGYARDGSLPFATLEPKIQGEVGTQRHRKGSTNDRSISVHRRQDLPTPCVDVVLHHIWLGVPS